MATANKKPAHPKPDTTAPVPTGDAPVDSLPSGADIAEQSPVKAPVEQQDTAVPPSDMETVPHKRAAVAAPVQEPSYRITSRHPNGFWRCGRKWLAAGEVLTLSEIGGAEVLAQLQAEPMLVVHEVGEA